MEIPITIIFLGLLIFFSHIFNSFFDKTRIPNAFLLMLVGIAIGPLLGLIDPQKDIGKIGSVFTTITLIVLLFDSGINLKFKEIKQSIGSAVILTIVNFILTSVIATVIFYHLTSLNELGQTGWLSAMFIGTIMGGTSSAVVIPMVRQLKVRERSTAVLILESALSDVFCLIIGLSLLEAMWLQELSYQNILNKIWKTFFFALLLGAFGAMIWIILLDLSKRIRNSMFSTLAFVFLIYGAVEMVNFNGGIAILTFGIIMGNSKAFATKKPFNKILKSGYNGLVDQERNFYTEIVFVLQTYFFVYIGLNIHFSHPNIFIIASAVIILVLIVRTMSIKIIPKKDLSRRDRLIMSIMSPKGLVTAVLASMPFYMGLPGGDVIQKLGYAIVFVSILICSFLVFILDNNPLFFHRIIIKPPSSDEKDNNNPIKETKEDKPVITKLSDVIREEEKKNRSNK